MNIRSTPTAMREVGEADGSGEGGHEVVARQLVDTSTVVAYDLTDSVSGLVGLAFEPPLTELLPDRERWRAFYEDLHATYRRDGLGPALQRFAAEVGLGANMDLWLSHVIRRSFLAYTPAIPTCAPAPPASSAEFLEPCPHPSLGSRDLVPAQQVELTEVTGQPEERGQQHDQDLIGSGSHHLSRRNPRPSSCNATQHLNENDGGGRASGCCGVSPEAQVGPGNYNAASERGGVP